MTIGMSYLAGDQSLDARAPMLVAGTSATARSGAARWIEEAGWRTAGLPIDGAVGRLALQAATSGLWIEVEAGDGGDALDQLLNHANAEAVAGRMPTIVAAPNALIDAVSARIDAPHIQLLIDPDPV